MSYRFLKQKKFLFFLLIILLLFISFPLLSQSNSGDFLTIEEREWLKSQNNKIRLAPCPGWEPMEMFEDDGTYHGMVADYIHIIEKNLDIKFKIIRAESWAEILDMARNRQLDMISAAKETPERKEYMDWTRPFFKSVNTIIVQKKFKGNLQDLQDMKMVTGVPEGYYTYEYFKEKYPKLNLVHVKDGLEGMKKVAFGEIDAMIMEVPHALYYIDKYNITNLRLGGTSDFYTDFSIGTRNDWPIFHSIMAKAIDQITEQQRKQINKKWIGLELPHFYQNKIFWYIIVIAFLIPGIITITILLWNRTLKIQVAQRTEELRFNETRLEALLELNHFDDASMKKVLQFAFKKTVQLTRSSFGYIVLAGVDDLVYSIDSLKKYPFEKDVVHHTSSGFPLSTVGLWGDAIKKKAPVIANNYPMTNPLKKGLPEEYPSIVRYMNIPVFNNNKIVAVAGVGNKKTDYDDSDLRQLTLLMEGIRRIIQRKEAETALRNSEKLFRDLVEHSLTGISIIQDNKTVYMNPEQQSIPGLIPILKSGETKNIHPEDNKKVKEFFDALKYGKSKELELNFRFYPDVGKSKTLEDMKWVNCRVNKIKYQGRKAVLLNIIDMTRAKELERLLFVQEKMVSMGHITAGIAHEIRNPLSGINIHLSNLEKFFRNNIDPSEKIKKILDILRFDAGRIESIIRRAMDFSKPNKPKFIITDINNSVKKVIQLTSVSLRKQNTVLESRLKNDLPKCYAEPQLIEDVIFNLITNATDAMKGMSKDKKLIVSSSVQDGLIVINVDDTGPGVDDHLREKIFEPFFTTKDYSTGIGLSICHRIIEDHGGILYVESNSWGSARFVMKIPVWREKDSDIKEQS